MRKIAHIVHPVVVPDSSDLRIAQPITFESMRVAQAFAREQVDVRLVYTRYADETVSMPKEFIHSAELTRNILPNCNFSRFLQSHMLSNVRAGFKPAPTT